LAELLQAEIGNISQKSKLVFKFFTN